MTSWNLQVLSHCICMCTFAIYMLLGVHTEWYGLVFKHYHPSGSVLQACGQQEVDSNHIQQQSQNIYVPYIDVGLNL